MKQNVLIPSSEKGNNLPLILLCFVQQSYGSGLFCSPVTIKGMCCEWPFLRDVVSYFTAISAPPQRMYTSHLHCVQAAEQTGSLSH